LFAFFVFFSFFRGAPLRSALNLLNRLFVTLRTTPLEHRQGREHGGGSLHVRLILGAALGSSGAAT
jgi:hypothetical protein